MAVYTLLGKKKMNKRRGFSMPSLLPETRKMKT